VIGGSGTADGFDEVEVTEVAGKPGEIQEQPDGQSLSLHWGFAKDDPFILQET
jgi:hypothetical protein